MSELLIEQAQRVETEEDLRALALALLNAKVGVVGMKRRYRLRKRGNRQHKEHDLGMFESWEGACDAAATEPGKYRVDVYGHFKTRLEERRLTVDKDRAVKLEVGP